MPSKNLKAGRDDLAADAKAEIELLSAYLPEQLTEEEIKVIVQQTIQETGASSKAEMGKVMSASCQKLKGVQMESLSIKLFNNFCNNIVKHPLFSQGVFFFIRGCIHEPPLGDGFF